MFGRAEVTSSSPAKVSPRPIGEYYDEAKEFHRRAVERAVQEGKPVPAEVLADYPELTVKAVPEPTTPQAPPAPSAPEAQGASARAQEMFDTLDGLIKRKAKDKAGAMRAQYGDEGFRAYFITSKFETIVEEAEENGKLTKKCP